MKIKKTTDYAMRVVRVMDSYGEPIVTSKAIAEKENISQGVLMKVLRTLKKHGIVESHQGRGEMGGGFSLARGTKEITLLDIIEAMEGKLYIHSQVKDPVSAEQDEAGLQQEMERVNRLLKDELKRYSIQEIFSQDKGTGNN